jgi:hypothetical protein
MIAIVLIFIVISLIVIPMFFKLKDVWLDNDNLIITGVKGERVILQKSDIVDITQNPSMVTPRLVRIKYKLFDSNPQFIRFIPKGGYWIFWEHGIVNELRDWMNEKASTQQRV